MKREQGRHLPFPKEVRDLSRSSGSGRCWSPSVRQEKGAQRLTFWVRRPPGGVGVFHSKGWLAENFVPALESLSSLGFEERNLACPGNFAGMSRTPGGVQKVCARKLRVQFSVPNQKLDDRKGAHSEVPVSSQFLLNP